MYKKYIKIIPGKKLKIKIINKAKFSQKLGNLFLEELNYYKINKNDNDIIPLLYSEKKIAVNINFVPTNNILNDFLKKMLFPFDLYICTDYKKQIKGAYFLNHIYKKNLFDNLDDIKKYSIIIDIETEKKLCYFQYGFVEACMRLILYKQTSYIFAESCWDSNELKLALNPGFIELIENRPPGTLETILNTKTKIDWCVCSSEIFTDDKIKSIKKFVEMDYLKRQLLFDSLKIISKNSMSFSKKFQFVDIKINELVPTFSISYSNLLDILLQYETITFDIFDTLVTRTVLIPDDIFNLIEEKSNLKLSDHFLKIRKKAELEAVKSLGRDVNLDDIYNFMLKSEKLTKTEIEKLKELEISLELEHITPRYDVVKLYKKLLKMGKKIDLISDMYLSKDTIVKILKKCGINDYRKLYLSNEQNMRKDSGELWDKYFSNNREKTIHVGDNYNSDYLQVLKRNRAAIKILSSQDYLKYSNILEEKELKIRSELAIIYNKFIFNSPFTSKEKIDNNLKLYGYYFLAPIFYTFFDWFVKNNKVQNILFVSREGYYLQPIYEKYCELFAKAKVNSIYFLSSRRAVTVSFCKTIEDLLEIAKYEYIGSIDNYFENRFGVTIPNLSKEEIKLPDDFSKVEKIIKDNSLVILKNAANERTNYLNYIKRTCKNIRNHNFGIVDLGYSGTIQYYLSKLLNKKIDGYYFALNNPKKVIEIGCNIIGCFNIDNNGQINIENNFYKKSLYLESFLSAPEGQLVCFNNNKPVFKDGTFNRQKKKYLDSIYCGTIDGLKSYKHESLKPFEIKTINAHYNFLCQFLNKSSGDLEKVLYLDDDFCRDGKNVVKLV